MEKSTRSCLKFLVQIWLALFVLLPAFAVFLMLAVLGLSAVPGESDVRSSWQPGESIGLVVRQAPTNQGVK